MTAMLLISLMGCTSATPLDAAGSATIANAIAAAPTTAEAVLTEHGATREAFEAALYDIAIDPEKTKAYLAARR